MLAISQLQLCKAPSLSSDVRKLNCAHGHPLQKQYTSSLPSIYRRNNSGIANTRLAKCRSTLRVIAAVKKIEDRHVVCCKTLEAKPDALEIVKSMCQEITEFSKKRQQSRESGIVSFECMQDQAEPNVLYFWERYETNAKLGQHSTTEEVKNFMEKIQQHLEKPIGLVLYEWRDGQLGAASMQGGPKGEGGLDDATGAGGKGAASMTQNLEPRKSSHTTEHDILGMKLKLPTFGLGKKGEEE